MADVMKVLSDLKYKAVGVDPNAQKMPEGYFVSFRPIGLPIPKEDFENPWTPTGSNLKQILDSKSKTPGSNSTTGQDPATIQPVSASKQLDDMQFLSAGIGASMQAFLQTFMLTDAKIVLDSSYRAAPDQSKINDAWFAIVNGANGIAPDLELNDEMKKSVDKAHAVLMDANGDSTPHYEKYVESRDKYQTAVRTRDKQYANALSDPMKLQMWPMQGKTYQDDVDFAWDQWQSFGFKQEIDEAIAILASQGIDPAILMIARAKHKYENSLVTIPSVGNIPYTFMTPSKWYSATDGDGWNSYSQTDFHSEVHFDSQTSHTDAGGGFSIGFFSVGGGGSADKTKTSLNIQTEGLTIEFEYATVDIQRPWLDTTLLNLNNWFLVGDYPASCISNGTFNQQFRQDNPTAMLFLPSIVTSLIVARNVVIKWNKKSTDIETLRTAASGGGSVGYGPFSISAHHSESHNKQDFTFDENSQGISIEGVQVIGYVSVITPGSPKKNGKDFMQKKKDEQPKTTPAATPAQPAPAPAPVK
ncbi:hypothetical protein GO495_03905 [Chitinophaga oryziterrae]|uniref:Uncharacterized protein n=1 Tax=Chitinophaga oryziterrae TaxID=1031224 RepID=A0A6N8J3D6_9BACT|nr:hypothetical protein [Chitinophaga oryziterrae]MVT39717.1 hypothetical protein [Chitinophaga oryziterrae]